MSSRAVREAANSIDSERQPLSQRLQQWVLVFGLCALLMFAILAFGAVEEWSIFTFEAGSAALFLLWASKQVVSRELKLSANPLYWPTLLFFGVIIAQIALHRSAYAYASKYEALQYFAYGLVLLISAECFREEATRKIFVWVMTIFGVFYAFYAIVQELTFNGKIFWIRSTQFQGAIYGSYVNHNHYASLMEMLVPFPLVLSLSHLLTGGKRALVAFCAVLMASTIFLSGSRGGMITFVLELVLFAGLTSRARRSPRVALGSAALCVLILAFLGFLDRWSVLGRLGELAPGKRLDIAKDSLKIFFQRPLWGWGFGTFPTIYPSYRTFYTNLFINEAHNDYAQLLVETGVLGFTLMVWFLVRLYQQALGTSRHWAFRWNGAVTLAALLGCTGILFHSFIDFNLQIPANAATFYVLCALATPVLPSEKGRANPN